MIKQLPIGDASEFGLLPETEGAQAADHLIERGLRKVYVLVSTDDFAQRAAEAFKAELASRGGELAGSITLPPGATSYADIIAGMHFPTGSTAAPASASSTAAPEPAVANDSGIFISMRPAQARLLLPQLRIAQVTLPVFATSHVYEGSDDAAANRDLDGVEFCDAPWLFDAQPGLPNHDDIAAQLPAARGGAARLFAFGMDAWNLVPYLDWLRAHPGSYMPGASGQLTADQFGRIRRVLIWAQFQNGLARPLGGSLQMDDMPTSAPPAGHPRRQPAPAPERHRQPDAGTDARRRRRLRAARLRRTRTRRPETAGTQLHHPPRRTRPGDARRRHHRVRRSALPQKRQPRRRRRLGHRQQTGQADPRRATLAGRASATRTSRLSLRRGELRRDRPKLFAQ